MISIIIPVYNSFLYLAKTLDSILDQTYENFEIILIDDGSTDGSDKICDLYLKKDDRIKVYHIENGGVSYARNFGLKKAKGDYIAFIDNDDYISPSYLQCLYDAIIKTGSRASMCYYKKIKEEDQVYEELGKDMNDSETTILKSEEMFKAIMAIPIEKTRREKIPYEFIWSKLYQRNLLDGLNFNNVVGEDIEFNSRLYLKKFDFALVQSTKYFWIQRPKSLHSIRNSEGFENYLYLFLSIINNIPRENIYFRGMGLKKLMLAALASNYAIKKYKYTDQSVSQVKYLFNLIKKLYLKEFLRNKTISKLFKFIIFNYIFIPKSYSISRLVIEKYKIV